MEQQKVDLFLMQRGECFPPEQIPIIRQKLMDLDENKAMMIQAVDYRNPTLMLVLSILVGSLGVDRFMLGDIGLGVLKLITCGGCGIWWIIDLILIMDKTRKYNFQKFSQYMLM